MSLRLYIPGPVEVSDKTYRAMTQPVMGHRGSEFVKLYRGIQPKLQELFGTQDPVFLSTSSAWGVMEGSLRNLVRRKVLCCMNGAFSDKWLDVARRCGLEAEGLSFEWGKPVDPESLRLALSSGQFDAVTLIHNETSTGTMSPLGSIMEVLRDFPEVMSIVDTVSSFSAMPIPKDDLGIDVLLTGSQKALALPPGLALFSVSARSLARSASLPNRGYYFDFQEFLRNHESGMTPSTPVIPLIWALKSKLEDIFEEGLEARYARHSRLNGMLRKWVEDNGFHLFPDPAFGSLTLVCVANNRGIDLKAFSTVLKERFRCLINTGYGKIAGTTFRISNMGDETDETISTLIQNLDQALALVAP